jgi:hypothetical protein
MKKLLWAIMPFLFASHSYSQDIFTKNGSKVGIRTTSSTTALKIVRGVQTINDYPSAD